MELFVVGDVHGCFHTFNKLIDDHWNRDKQVLVQLGDLLDRGNFSPETILYAIELQKSNPDKVKFLKGNHEFEVIQHLNEGNENWFRQCGQETIKQFERKSLDLINYISWMESLPLYFETDNVFISHAGISLTAENPMEESHPESVLWTRGQLKNLGKLQIIGHTPCKSGRAELDKKSNTLNIDTGAYRHVGLSAVKVNGEGKIKEIVFVPTVSKDVTA
ncbi:serine/threonine protein phosphatase 1 [Paenibacillus uliginis N3/975]|uniref:Serine/threonine protein phosphatase 1 n=1 Tax=Paenibacillus uliginis N3/975 TaxID=1313296 RepID=A0A1X7HDF4_9BACL|nr:metallophosphoesterase family protein [Paenibacillus uliginis]SMF84480.1 serine/threonine protein phosphatase 1 [Paenibacillus uliginis N3/975]